MIANALDFQRERRVALALTRGFVPGPLPELEGFDAGLVYEPSGHAAGGGDFFGIWRLPSGSVALLVGDVSGKGIEVAAISAMVRFFIEARTWDATDPAEVIAADQRAAAPAAPGHDVRARRDDGDRRRHDPLVQRRPHRRRCCSAPTASRELRGTGLPLGVDEDAVYTTEEATLSPATSYSPAPTGSPRLAATAASSATSGSTALLRRARPHARARARWCTSCSARPRRWAPSLDDDMVILALRRQS